MNKCKYCKRGIGVFGNVSLQMCGNHFRAYKITGREWPKLTKKELLKRKNNIIEEVEKRGMEIERVKEYTPEYEYVESFCLNKLYEKQDQCIKELLWINENVATLSRKFKFVERFKKML